MKNFILFSIVVFFFALGVSGSPPKYETKQVLTEQQMQKQVVLYENVICSDEQVDIFHSNGILFIASPFVPNNAKNQFLAIKCLSLQYHSADIDIVKNILQKQSSKRNRIFLATYREWFRSNWLSDYTM